ncbi:MAG TPA: helix-turn-helix domain-containing protein [Marinilabiliaceae bacterium]|uniref:Helix-turn-helix domain-containing protein n=1 Tax=Aequorivita echinoideorum TaxID=1549647 RepID=A0ABS5S4Y1_9FLAO|nr:helix-turn-helix domain-containing protein [Aequorivita echinoideorum]MBT0608028.1 helix-turn-helix domain-containing protein [Aequorivita echinoideorum]HLW07761.1 helix-turn-helix domain-containing protein [Marinilabiliaceae bacterium]
MEPLQDTSIQEWNKLYNRFQSLVNKLENSITKDPELVLLDNADLLQLFKISHKTAQNWRDNKVIAFSQIGNKIYYRLSDIKKLLDANYKPINKR